MKNDYFIGTLFSSIWHLKVKKTVAVYFWEIGKRNDDSGNPKSMISARKERNGQLAESGRSQFKIIISWTSPNNENNNNCNCRSKCFSLIYIYWFLNQLKILKMELRLATNVLCSSSVGMRSLLRKLAVSLPSTCLNM